MVTNNSQNTYIVPTANHEVTMPLQPAFTAYLSASDTNVTGNGTNYRIGTNVAWTEIKDQNADFNTNGTFTSPVTGLYFFTYQVRITSLTASSTNFETQLVTSNRTYTSCTINSGAARGTANDLGIGQSYFTDMDSGDTATFHIIDTGEGSDIIDINGGNGVTFFQGYLGV